MNSKHFWHALGMIQKEKFKLEVKIINWPISEKVPWRVMHEHHIIFSAKTELECKAWANFHRMEY